MGDWKNTSCITKTVDGNQDMCGIGTLNRTRTCEDGTEQKCHELSEDVTQKQLNCSFQACPPGNLSFLRLLVYNDINKNINMNLAYCSTHSLLRRAPIIQFVRKQLYNVQCNTSEM